MSAINDGLSLAYALNINNIATGNRDLSTSSVTTSDEARISRLSDVIRNLNADSQNKPQFEIVSGTCSYTDQERESVGVAFSNEGGLTFKCTYFGMGPEMIKFFDYLADDKEITSFMPCAVGGGYLQGADPAIAECVKRNNTLVALDVHYCMIGKEGVLNIVNALEHNTSLKYLNVRANGINDEILTRMLEILKNHNRTLQRFSFTQNNFLDEKALSKQLIAQIDTQLKENAQRSGTPQEKKEKEGKKD